jgi:micrococcal nuclease
MLSLATAALGLALALVGGTYAVARTDVDAASALVVAAVLLAGAGTVATVAAPGSGPGPWSEAGATAAADVDATDRHAATPVAADTDATPVAAAPAGTTGTTTATVVDVLAGDRVTYRTADGTLRTVGLAGVDAPGVDGADPQRFDGVLTGDRGRTCLADRGRRALLSLRSSLRGESVTVHPVATDRGGPQAVLAVDGRSVNRRQVARGHARATDERYAGAAADARSAHRGVWSCGVVTPERPLREVGEPGLRIAAVHPNPVGDDAAALDEEYVVVENAGRTTVDLADWYLREGDGRLYFSFDDRRLEPGDRLVVHVGEGRSREGHVYWGAGTPVLDNDHETLKLVDGDTGRVVRLSY